MSSLDSLDVVLICTACGALWVLVDFLIWLLWPELWRDLHRGE